MRRATPQRPAHFGAGSNGTSSGSGGCKRPTSPRPFPDAQGNPAKACVLRGGIAAFVDSAGNPVVEYRCDAWGKPTSTTGSLKTSLRELNPFRYRGYVHDEEIGLYYLEKKIILSGAGTIHKFGYGVYFYSNQFGGVVKSEFEFLQHMTS